MLRYLGLLILPLLIPATSASALTVKQKLETCQIGAKAEHLTGAKRKAFLRRCMAKDAGNPHMDEKPSAAHHRLTAQEKMETCKIGADAEQLTSAKRAHFILRCMAKGNYVPKARKQAMKHIKGKK